VPAIAQNQQPAATYVGLNACAKCHDLKNDAPGGNMNAAPLKKQVLAPPARLDLRGVCQKRACSYFNRHPEIAGENRGSIWGGRTAPVIPRRAQIQKSCKKRN